jgi:quercetin dioxygenase-like cupin family protein
MADPQVIKLTAGTGRIYEMQGMRAIFKADEAETKEAYSVSEWWLDAHQTGPGAHSHETNDEVFYGIGGVMAVRAGEEWHDIGPGDFLRIPAGTIHDFENRTDARAGLLNFFIPGGFERNMPAIVDWFKENG